MRLEALGLLAGGVAHDFNNILAVIRANVELARGALGGRPPDVPVALSDLAEVERAVERASELVRQLLAFGRRQRLTPEPLDLNVVTRETIALVRVLLGDAVQVVVRATPELPRVRADRPQMEQVLVSLVLNGRDAIVDAAKHDGGTAHVGTLTITTRIAQVDTADVVRIGVPRAGRYATLEVRDNGVGMTESTRARIFEPFFTTKAIDRGAGLGLAATWGIVRQSGGAVHVESTPGVGSTFTVYLPVYDPAADSENDSAAPATEAATGPATTFMTATPTNVVRAVPADAPLRLEVIPGAPLAPAGVGPTVLLAEDDHAVRRATSRILRGAGYQVLEAGDGRSALALWRARAQEIDVLVADLRMPHLRGDALARAVRSDEPALPVVLMTGFGEDPFVAGGLYDNATGGRDASTRETPLDAPVLAKPFGAAELLGHVAASLAAGRGSP